MSRFYKDTIFEDLFEVLRTDPSAIVKCPIDYCCKSFDKKKSFLDHLRRSKDAEHKRIRMCIEYVALVFVSVFF